MSSQIGSQIVGFLDTYKYQILVILLLIFLWRALSQNIILVLIIAVLAYFVWSENRTKTTIIINPENK